MVTLDQMDMEVKIIRTALSRTPTDIVTALSVASGSADSIRIKSCGRMLDEIAMGLKGDFPSDIQEGLERIYRYYRSGEWEGNDEISFVSAVDNFTNAGSKSIGNCWTRSSIFYVLAQNLGINMGFTVDISKEHSSLRTIGENPILVDLNEGVDVERYEGEEDVSFVDHLSMAYINRLDTVTTVAEKAQLCRGAMILSPERPEAYSELAAAHIEYGGDLPTAARLCQHAINLGKGNKPLYRANLILSYHFAKKSELAREEFRRLEAEYPTFEHLDKLREKLRGN